MSIFTFGRFCRMTLDTFWNPMSPSAPSPPTTRSLRQFADFLVGHQRVVEVREQGKIKWLRRPHLVGVVEQGVGQAFGHDRAAGMVQDEAIRRAATKSSRRPGTASSSTDTGAGSTAGGTINGIAAGAGAHEHDADAVGAATVNGLQIAVIEATAASRPRRR